MHLGAHKAAVRTMNKIYALALGTNRYVKLAGIFNDLDRIKPEEAARAQSAAAKLEFLMHQTYFSKVYRKMKSGDTSEVFVTSFTTMLKEMGFAVATELESARNKVLNDLGMDVLNDQNDAEQIMLEDMREFGVNSLRGFTVCRANRSVPPACR